jgi:Fe-Mn family superoxide dismutase
VVNACQLRQQAEIFFNYKKHIMNSETKTSRRDFIKTGGKATIAATLTASALSSIARGSRPLENTPYTQTPLSYDYKALEPSIDAMTMEIHYTKHAAAYAKNLADASARLSTPRRSVSTA